MYKWGIYKSTDDFNWQLSTARKDFGYEGQDMYAILEDGKIIAVQSETIRPYKNCTLEECAEKHVAELIEWDKNKKDNRVDLEYVLLHDNHEKEKENKCKHRKQIWERIV